MITRTIEFSVLFFLCPTLYVLCTPSLNVIPLLVVITLGFLIVLLCDRNFDRKQLWNTAGLTPQLRRILHTFVLSTLLIGVGVWFFKRDLLFSLIRNYPLIWGLVMVLYPFLSVYPQELFYRTFFFHRYKKLFPKPWMIIGANAIAFSYMHIVFQNIIAVVLSLFGGFLFGVTYYKTRSTFASTFEHAIYGCLIFTIGLGTYFFSGSTSIILMLCRIFFGEVPPSVQFLE